MRVVRYAFGLAAMLTMAASLAHAQVASETRLRVAVNGTRTIGSFYEATDTTLIIRTPSGLLSFNSRQINQVERSTGRAPNLVTGAAGLVIGAALGGLVGCAVNSDDYGVFCGGQSDTKVAVGAAVGGLTLGALGALLFKRDRWQAVDFPFRTRFEP